MYLLSTPYKQQAKVWDLRWSHNLYSILTVLIRGGVLPEVVFFCPIFSFGGRDSVAR
jgi:hypothetical protein